MRDRRVTRHAGLRAAPERVRRHHPDYNKLETQGWKALDAEGKLPSEGWKREMQWALDMGLPGAECLTDRSIPTFSRGEKPHFAGINTFLKAPYVENVRHVGKYDAAVLGVPFDGGATYRPGTRFGPQGIRRISCLYTPYGYDTGVDLREQMTLCDVGDVFAIPGNLEKSFDQITRGVSHVFSSGALPLILGGDHSIGFPCVRGIAQCTSKRIGIIHFDRHIDMQATDMDERMHSTPWYWATELPNVSARNLVQLGIGGWQVPRYATAEVRKRESNVLTNADIEKLGMEKTAEIALELAWKDTDAVYISFVIDSVECGFVPGTGWPEPGGFLPREALKILGLVAAEGVCGLEVVEVAPCYDTSDITSLLGTRIVVETLGAQVANGKLGAHKGIIDKPVSYGAASAPCTTTTRTRGMATTTTHPQPVSGRAITGPRRPCSGRSRIGPRAAAPMPRRRPNATSTSSSRASSRASAGPRTRPASCASRGSRSWASMAPGGGCTSCRVEMESLTDVGAVVPLLGGAGVRYDPLPAPTVSQRRRLAFVYHDGSAIQRLDFAEARRLTDESGASHFAVKTSEE